MVGEAPATRFPHGTINMVIQALQVSTIRVGRAMPAATVQVHAEGAGWLASNYLLADTLSVIADTISKMAALREGRPYLQKVREIHLHPARRMDVPACHGGVASTSPSRPATGSRDARPPVRIAQAIVNAPVARRDVPASLPSGASRGSPNRCDPMRAVAPHPSNICGFCAAQRLMVWRRSRRSTSPRRAQEGVDGLLGYQDGWRAPGFGPLAGGEHRLSPRLHPRIVIHRKREARVGGGVFVGAVDLQARRAGRPGSAGSTTSVPGCPRTAARSPWRRWCRPPGAAHPPGSSRRCGPGECPWVKIHLERGLAQHHGLAARHGPVQRRNTGHFLPWAHDLRCRSPPSAARCRRAVEGASGC